LWRCLREAIDVAAIDINAYVFMPNHIHLLVTPTDPLAIAKAMHAATRRYSGYFNKRYDRTGTLWEGRYRASTTLTQQHFLNCHRYIDLNPVRASIAPRPEEYPWSSHRFYAHGESNSLVRPHHAMAHLGAEAGSLQSEYRTLLEAPLEARDLEEIRACTEANRDMGRPAKVGRPRKFILAPFF
jgi:putative transposase